MKLKAIILFILLAVFIVGLNSVSAGEIDDNNVTLSESNVYDVESSLDSVDYADENVLSANPAGTFSDLQRVIDENTNGTIELDRGYTYSSSADSNLVTGVVINKSLVIEGNFMKINGNNLARIFNISANNVVLKNLALLNGLKPGDTSVYAGGILWNGDNATVSYCNFTDIRQDRYQDTHGVNIYFHGSNLTIDHCSFLTNNNNNFNKRALYLEGSNITVVHSNFTRFTCGILVNNTDFANISDNRFTTMYAYTNSGQGLTNFNYPQYAVNVDRLIFNNNYQSGGTTSYFYYINNFEFKGNEMRSMSLVDIEYIYNAVVDGNYIYSLRETYGHNAFILISNYRAKNSNLTFINNRIDYIAQGRGPDVNIQEWANIFAKNNTWINCIYTASDGSSRCIYMNNVNNLTFYNNTLYNSSHRVSLCYFGNVKGYIFNNTFELLGTAVASNGILQTAGGNTNIIIENNTFTDCFSEHSDALSINGALWCLGGGTVIFNDNTAVNFTYTNKLAVANALIEVNSGTITINNSKVINCSITGEDGCGLIYSHAANAKITNNQFINFSADISYGGILYNTAANVVFANNTIDNLMDFTGYGGVIYNTGASLLVEGNNISNVNAGTSAGVINNTGNTIKIINNNITNCSAEGDAGAFYIGGKNANVSGNYFENVHADRYGVILAQNADGSLFYNNTYVNNYANSNGIVGLYDGVTLNNENFTDNHAIGQAGVVIFEGKNSNLNNSIINNSNATKGGAIYNSAGALNNRLNNVSIYNSRSLLGDGGAIYCEGDGLTINELHVYNSVSSGDGGAIFNSGSSVKLHNSTFFDITAESNGGAVYWSGDDGEGYNITINNSQSRRSGGAIYWIGNNGYIDLLNISNSFTDEEGGAVYWGGHFGTLSNVTFEKIHAAKGGAVYWSGNNGTLDGKLFKNIYSDEDGGAIYWVGVHATILNIEFINITATYSGGAIYGTSYDSYMDSLTFDKVNALNNGGAISWMGGNSLLSNATFTNVNSSVNGGAIYWSGDKSRVKSSKFENVTSRSGGAIYWTSIGSALDNVTFVNVSATGSGGAIYWSGNEGNITNGTFLEVTAENGGAISVSADTVTIGDCNFTNCNSSNIGGGVYLIGSSSYLSNLSFYYNNATFKGGAIYLIGSNSVLNELYVIGSNVSSDGAALVVDGVGGKLFNSTFINNTAVTNGGAIYWGGNEGEMHNVTLINNSATNGGAVYWAASECLISNVTFINGNAIGSGGALYMGGLRGCVVNDTVFINCSVREDGGVVYWTSDAGIFANSTVINSNATNGGAVYWSGSDGEINNLSVNNVFATENGGVLLIGGSGVDVNNVLFNNSNASYGGAVYWSGHDGRANNVNFTNNSATFNGGAFYLLGSNFELSNATFISNNASNFGGAIYLISSIIIYDSNFTRNRAVSGSAIYNAGSTTIYNTEILNNKANISSIEINNRTSNIDFIADVTIRGNDNFLNGIFTVSNDIKVSSVTYLGAWGITTSGVSLTTPTNTPSANYLYYDTRLAGIPINVTIKDNRTGEIKVDGAVSTTDVYGTVSQATIKSQTRFIIDAIHFDDDYYTAISTSAYKDSPKLDPTLDLSLNMTEIPYKSYVNMSVRLFAEIDYTASGLNESVEIYLNDEYYTTVRTVDGVYEESFFFENITGDYNISARFNGTTIHVPSGDVVIASLNSSVVDFTIVKAVLPINISINTTDIYVDDNVGFVITGPDDYTGNVEYMAGIYGKSNLTDSRIEFNNTYYKQGVVNVLVFAENDTNYLAGMCNLTFYVHPKDIDLQFVSVSNINVGDVETIIVKLNVTDVTGNVIITVNGVDYNAAIDNSYANVSIYYLPNGTYNVSANYKGDNRYNSSQEVTTEFTVSKINTTVEVTVNSPYVGENAVVNVNVNSSIEGYVVNGYVTVTVDNVDYNLTIVDGSGSLTVFGLSNGSYPVDVVYSGDNQFVGNSNNTAILTVNKVGISTITVTPVAQSVYVSGEAVLDISVDSSISGYLVNGFVTVKINDTEFNVSIINGKGSLTAPITAEGVYDVNVSYTGDDRFGGYDAGSVASIVADKVSIQHITVLSNPIYVGEEAVVSVRLIPEISSFAVNDYVTIYINNNSYNVSLTDGIGSLSVYGLKEGSYDVNLSFAGNNIFNPINASSVTFITVSRINVVSINVTPASRNIYVGEYAEFTVNLTSANEAYSVNGYVTVTVNYNDFNVSISNGSGSFKVYDLPKGVYDINIVYAGDDQFNSRSFPKVASITVDKVDIKSITVTPQSQDIYVGQATDFTIKMTSNVTGYNVNGFVTVTVNNKPYTVPISNNSGSFSISGLSEGTYNVMLSYAGDDVYNSVANAEYAVINVNKVGIENIIVTPVSPNIYVGQSANFSIKLVSNVSDYNVNGFVVAKVYNRDYIVSIINNTGLLNVVGLTAGSYQLNISYGGDDVFTEVADAKYADINVDRVDIQNIAVTPQSQVIYFGQAADILIRFTSAVEGYNVAGLATVRANNKSYVVSIVNNTGSLSIPGLTGGVHSVNVSFDGNDIFNPKDDATYASVTVKKIDIASINVTPEYSSVAVGQSVDLTIKMDAGVSGYDVDDYVTVTVNNKEYNVSIINNTGFLSIYDLPNGSYVVNLVYGGNSLYNPVASKKYADIDVGKVNITDITVSPVSQEIYVGEDADFTISVVSSITEYVVDGFVTVTIGGNQYNVSIKDGSGIMHVPNLSYGNYSVSVAYNGNDIYARKYVDDAAEVIVNKINIKNINVTPVSQNISAGQDATIAISMESSVSGREINDYVTVTVNNFKYNVSISNGKGSLTIHNLNSGYHEVLVSYAGSNIFNSVDEASYANINVSKVAIASIAVTPVSQSIDVGANAVINIRISPVLLDYLVNDYVTVSVGNNKYNVSIVNNTGSLTVNGLSEGVYEVNVSFNGNNIYDAVSDKNYAGITVNRIDVPFILVNSNSIYVGEDAIINISLVSQNPNFAVNDYVNVSLDNKNYIVPIINGTGSLTVPNLNNGIYQLNVSFAGNDQFKPINVTGATYITVNKINIESINVTPKSRNIYVGEDAEFAVELITDTDVAKVNGYVVVSVNGNDFNVSIINNNGSFKVYGLSEGSYGVNIVYNGDDQFNSKAYPNAAVINVIKVGIESINVLPNSQDIYVGQVANLTVKMLSNVTGYNINGYVTVTVNNKAYNVSISNNSGSLSVLGLNAGNYDVNVAYAGNDIYTSVADATYASINVNKVDVSSITVTPGSQNIYVGQVANLTVKMQSAVTGYDINGFVTVTVNGKSYDVSINNNSGSLSVLGLNAGDHDVNVAYAGSDIYNSVTDSIYASINVDKVDVSSITVTPVSQSIYVGQVANLTVKMQSAVAGYDINGYVTVTVDNKKYNVSINNNTGSLVISGLANGNYDVNVAYAGSDVYTSVNDNAYANITVNKVGIESLEVTPVSQSIDVGENANIDINIKSNVSDYNINGYVTVTVNNINYNVSIANNTGSLIIPNLANGTYAVNVSYAGSNIYNSVSDKKYADIYVHKVAVDKITVTPVSQNINVGEDAVIAIEITSKRPDYLINDYVTVTVGDAKYNVSISDNNGSLTVHGLAEGNYSVNVAYAGSTIYDAFADAYYANISVNKVNISSITVTPTEQDVYIGKDASINIKVTPAVSGYAVNGFVTVTVDGIKYNVSLTNGTGSLVVSGLNNGVYDVNVSYAGDDVFNPVDDDKYASINVNKVDITSLTVTPVLQFVYVGQNATLTIKMLSRLPDYIVNGFVTVDVAGVKYNVSIINGEGSLTIHSLAEGVYDVNVSYAGSEIFLPVEEQTFASIIANKVNIPSVIVNTTSPIYVGQNSTVDIKLISEVPEQYIVNGYVTIVVDGRKYDVPVINGIGSIVIHDLAAGVYPVNLSYDGDDIFKNIENRISNYITVNKVDIDDISVNLTSPIYVGQNVSVAVNMTSSVPDEYVVSGYVTVNVDDREYNVSIVNGTGSFVIPSLGNGTYNMVISYDGDNVYNPKSKEILHSIVVVNKIETSIEMDNVVLNVGDIANITAVINSTEVTGNVTFIVDNVNYTVGIVDGVAHVNVSNLNTSANTTVTAIYSGDYKYTNSTVAASLIISKVDGNANISVYNITAGETETVIINLPADLSNATVTVKFNGDVVNDYIINNNVISFNRTIESSGTYSVSADVVDDCKYYDFSVSDSFFVSKVKAENYTIAIEVNNTKVFELIPVTVRLPNDANETLSLSVDGNLINGSVNVIKGVAVYTLDNLTYGNHTITVSYGNDKYDDKTVSTNVFVAKVNSAINIITPADARVAHDIIINLIPINSTGAVTVTINGEEYEVISRSTVNASGLLEGNYTVVAKLAEDDYFLESTSNTVFVVLRNDVSMILEQVDDVLVDSPAVLRVNFTENVTGNVTFNVNGMNYTFNITESDFAEYIWIPKTSGVVIVKASYSGNDTYYPSVCNDFVMFNVNKNEVSFPNIIVKDIMVGDDENIIISLNATDVTGVVYVDINDTVYEANVMGGLAFPVISNLAWGDYVMTVYYPGDDKYSDVTSDKFTFTVNRYDTPISINASDIMVYDDAVIIVTLPEEITETVSIKVHNASIDLPVVDGKVEWVVSDLPAGTYEVFVNYEGNYKYLPNSSSASFIVDHYTADVSMNISGTGWTGDDFNINIDFPEDATGNVTVNIDGVDYTLPVNDGNVEFNISDIPAGNHTATVTYSGDYKYANMTEVANFTIYSNYMILNVDNVTKYYKGSERLRINLTNARGDLLSNQSLKVIINGVEYVRVTNENGSCSLPINLLSGEYDIDIIYEGDGKYSPINTTAHASVLSTIVANDLIKVYRNGSQFYARFLDSEGNALVGATVSFNINGVFYNRTTNDEGWAKLNINLPQGVYVITSYNPVTGESCGNAVEVLSRITDNWDLIKEYRNGSQYVVCIIGDNGEHVGAGEEVTFNINGVFYTRTTNATGHVKLNINLPEGKYIITVSYMGCTVSNKITVIPKMSDL